MHGEHCENCPLRGKAEAFDAKGMHGARFLVVTDAPNHRPEAYGRLMPQGAMTLFARLMLDEEFDRQDFVFYPQIRCPHDPDLLTAKERTAIQKACRPYFLEAVDHYRPEVILPLGANAAKQVLGRAIKIMKARGVPDRTDELGRTVILPMLNPMMAVLYPQHQPTLRADCATLGRLVDHNYNVAASSQSAMGDYTYIDDLQFLVDQRPRVVAFDLEGTGLRWYAPDAAILTMQFSVEEGVAYALPWDHPEGRQSARAKQRLRKQLRGLLCRDDVTVVGHNLSFDCVYTRANAGINFKIGGDTLMLATLLDENSTSRGLSDLVKKHVADMAGYSDLFDNTVDKSRMIDLPLDDDFLNYAAGDADAALRLYNVLYPMVAEDDRLLTHYRRVTLPGLNAFAAMELRGQYIDEAAVDAFEAYMEQEVAAQEVSLMAQVPKSIKRKHAEKGMKFSRPEVLRDILFTHPDGFRLKPKVFTKGTAKLEKSRRVPSTSTKDHLPHFFDECPFTYELAEYVKQMRILTANVKGFKKKYIVDGKVRPTYNLHTAVTGRSASRDPNGQNIVKRHRVAKAYRRIFVAPPGHFLVTADLSQAELRIAADMAGDPTMIRIYREGGDIHRATALIVLGVSEEQFSRLDPKEQKAARQKAKAVNFGFLYGMGWRKFIAYAKTDYGVTFTEDEAQRIREGFFSKYRKLPEWHARMREYARAHGFVRSYDGRIRHLPMINSPDDMIRSEAERQAINSPVQGFASDIGVMAMGRIVEEVDPQYFELVGFVHDALYAYVPTQYLEWGVKTLKWYLESNPFREWFGFDMKLPIVADAGFGPNLGDVWELPDLTVGPDGEVDVEEYPFEDLWADAPDKALDIPIQEIPPNNGRLSHTDRRRA